jgi:hypothetical protein
MSKMTDLSFKKGQLPAFMFVTGHVIKPHNGFNNSVPAGENLGLWEKLLYVQSCQVHRDSAEESLSTRLETFELVVEFHVKTTSSH